MKTDIEIDSTYWVGDYYYNDGWKRLTLFHRRTNSHGGSLNTPIATIDIVKHPGHNGCNAHSEILFRVRNDVKQQGTEILVDKNAEVLRRFNDVVDPGMLASVVEKLKETRLASLPLSIYISMEHVARFETQGDFWNED